MGANFDMTNLRQVWDRYGVFAGILGLIVDTLTLTSFFVFNFGWSEASNTNNTQMPYDTNRLIFITSGAVIVLGFVAICYYIPTLENYYTEKYTEVWISSSYYEYKANLHMVMFALACIFPVTFLWLRLFFLWPQNHSMFILIFIASIVLLFLCLLAAFHTLQTLLNMVFVSVGAILLIYITAYGLTDWNLLYALAAATITSSLILLYLKIMTLFPEWKFYGVKRFHKR